MNDLNIPQPERYEIGDDAFVVLSGLVGEVTMLGDGNRQNWVKLKMYHSELANWYHIGELRPYKELLDKFKEV